MTINPQKVQKVKEALDNTYEKKVNKKSTIPAEPGTNDYPTSNAVKNFVEGKNYLTNHQDISGKEDKSNKVTSTDSWSVTTSDDRYPSEKLVKNSLDRKLEASDIAGKVDSSDLARVATTGSYSDLDDQPSFATVAITGDYTDLDNTPHLATVATTGDYNDLTNTPTIPTSTSDLINDSGFLTTHQDISGKVDKEAGKGLFSGSYTDLTDKPSSWASSTITDSNTYSNIENSSGTQESINNAINGKIGSINTAVQTLLNTEFIKTDTDDGNGNPNTTASADTMNTIYLVKATSGKDDNYNEFITVQSGTSGSYTYSWEKIGTTSLDLSGYAQSSSLSNVATSGSYADLSNKPSYTPTVTSSTTDSYKIGSININGSDVDIYGVDSGTSVLDIDSEINDALDELAGAIYPAINYSTVTLNFKCPYTSVSYYPNLICSLVNMNDIDNLNSLDMNEANIAYSSLLSLPQGTEQRTNSDDMLEYVLPEGAEFQITISGVAPGTYYIGVFEYDENNSSYGSDHLYYLSTDNTAYNNSDYSGEQYLDYPQITVPTNNNIWYGMDL